MAGEVFADVPLYAGAAATQQGARGLTPFNQADYEKVEWHWYAINNVKADQVSQFYRTELTKPEYGCKETGWNSISTPSTAAWGTFSKDNDDKLVYVFAADDNKGNTQLVIARAKGKRNK